MTPDQKRILLILCNAAETGTRPVRLVCEPNGVASPIRETTTGAALVRAGLALRHADGRYSATHAGYWCGAALRIDDRLGKIPERRTRDN